MLVTKISKRDKPELEDMGILKIISDREANPVNRQNRLWVF
jgi:hypothetical protein